jgi:hypothetical protein
MQAVDAGKAQHPRGRVIPIEWLLIAEELRRELRRFDFSARELRLLDVIITYSLCRGCLSAQISKPALMRLARLDDSGLSKALKRLKDACVLQVSENVTRDARARCRKGDCPTLEILLESKNWFSQQGSDRDRKRLEQTAPTEANLIHNGLCEVNPVHVDLPPMGLPESYALVVQECKRDRMAEAGLAAASEIGSNPNLADRAGAIGAAPVRSETGVKSGDRAPGGAPEPTRRRWVHAIEDPSAAQAIVAEIDGREAFVKKTNAHQEEHLSKKQMPTPNNVENLGFAGVSEAFVKKTNAPQSTGTYKASKDCTVFITSKPSKGEYEGATAAEALVKKTNAPAAPVILFRAADFVSRLYQLLMRARDTRTIADWRSWGSWWRNAFICTPEAAEEALNDLQLRLDSTLPLDKPGGWTRSRYREHGGQWIGKSQATDWQRDRLQAVGVRFYDTPFLQKGRAQP